MHVAETLTINGHTVEICYDPDFSTDLLGERLGRIVLNPSRGAQNLGIADQIAEPDEIEAIAADPRNVALPVFVLDHSGIALRTTSFNDPWDSAEIGVIYADEAAMRANFELKPNQPISAEQRRITAQVLDAEIKELSDVFGGQVYGYRVFDADGEEIDSCWGFVGEAGEAEALRQATEATQRAA